MLGGGVRSPAPPCWEGEGWGPDPLPDSHTSLAAALHRFNAHVRADPRTEVVLIPLRDGLTLIRRH